MAPSYDELLTLVESQRRDIERLQARVDELTRALEAAQRQAKRQAAPFSKKAPKPNPQTPGRKAGDRHGPHGHRPPPADDRIDEHLDAPLPAACPHCRGAVVETHQDIRDRVELPAQPLRRRIHIHCGQCQQCGRRLRGRHPLQTGDATGAAASQVGPQAQAPVVYLNKHAGLSHGKTADVLTHLGIPPTRGAGARIMPRAGRKLRPVYQDILRALPDEKHLTPDETGWRLGGRLVWLHAWVGAKIACFAIDPQRGADALGRVIGFDWSGDMTHDGAAAYDRFLKARHQQCVFHVPHRARDLEQVQAGRAQVFPRQVITLFQGALEVRDRFRAGVLDGTALQAAHDHYVEDLFALSGLCGELGKTAIWRTWVPALFHHLATLRSLSAKPRGGRPGDPRLHVRPAARRLRRGGLRPGRLTSGIPATARDDPAPPTHQRPHRRFDAQRAGQPVLHQAPFAAYVGI